MRQQLMLLSPLELTLRCSLQVVVQGSAAGRRSGGFGARTSSHGGMLSQFPGRVKDTFRP